MQKHVSFFIVAFLLILGIFLTRNTKLSWNIKSDETTPTLPAAPTSALANPASVNCQKVGGTLQIRQDGAGNEYGLCEFGNNMACEEWALFRGECPVGGIKTTGFDSLAQKYCAWLGGKTFAVPNAKCTFSDGSVCTYTSLYNDTCHKGQK